MDCDVPWIPTAGKPKKGWNKHFKKPKDDSLTV
jgi:hypothetical protein